MDNLEEKRPGTYQAFTDFLTLSVLPDAYRYLPMKTEDANWQRAVRMFAIEIGSQRLHPTQSGCALRE